MTDTPFFDCSARSEETIRHLEALIGQPGVSEDYVRLRIGLLKAQAAALAELGGEPLPDIPLTQPLPQGERSSGGTLRPEMVRFDPAVARRLFDAVDEVFRSCGHPGMELSKLRSAVDEEPAVLQEMMTRAAFEPDQECLGSLAGRLEVPAGLVLLVGRVLAAPFVTGAAARIEQPEAAAMVSDGYCPVCDSPPGLAQLRADDGKRVLHCSLCGHAWEFPRLACPFCGSGDQAVLGKLMVEGEETRWIEACRHCKQYLKTVDQRRLGQGQEVIPLAEEVAGLYLDLLAEKEGYRPNLPYAAVQGAAVQGTGVGEQESEGRRAGGR